MNTHRKQLLNLLCKISSPSTMDKVLQALLTPKELAEVEKRLQIFHQLEQQVPQREIATSLGVGIATVTRGARALHAGDFPAEVMQTISNKPK